MLDLFYAQSLVTYYQAYSWEIDHRERVEATGPIDLKSWTRDQIFDEAWTSRSFASGRTASAWPGRTAGRVPRLLEPGRLPGRRPRHACATPSSISWPGSSPTPPSGRRANRTRPGFSTSTGCFPRVPGRQRPGPRSSSPPRPTRSKKSPPCSASTNPGAAAPAGPKPPSRPASSSSGRSLRRVLRGRRSALLRVAAGRLSPRSPQVPLVGHRPGPPGRIHARRRMRPTPSSGPASSRSKASSASPPPPADSTASTSSSPSKRPACPRR